MPRKKLPVLEGPSCIVCVNLATHDDLCEQCAAREAVTRIFSDKPLKAKHLAQEAEKAYASGAKLTLEQEAFRFFELPFYAFKWRDALDLARKTRRTCIAIKAEQERDKEPSAPKPKTPRKTKPLPVKVPLPVPEVPIVKNVESHENGKGYTPRPMVGKKYNTLIVVADLNVREHAARKIRVICSVCNKILVVKAKDIRDGSCEHYECNAKKGKP